MGTREYFFSRDGWVINNIPLVDMDNFDLTTYRNDPSNRLFIGRYRVDGSQIHIVWANNADRRDVIKYDEAAANPGIDTYIPTCRCTGKGFSGKYHWSSPTDERYVQFFPDGSFFDHGLTDQVVEVPNPHGYSGITDPPRNFRGTYSVRNQRLTFNFADGSTWTNNANANWSDTTRWLNGIIADGIDATANFNAIDITAARTSCCMRSTIKSSPSRRGSDCLRIERALLQSATRHALAIV